MEPRGIIKPAPLKKSAAAFKALLIEQNSPLALYKLSLTTAPTNLASALAINALNAQAEDLLEAANRGYTHLLEEIPRRINGTTEKLVAEVIGPWIYLALHYPNEVLNANWSALQQQAEQLKEAYNKGNPPAVLNDAILNAFQQNKEKPDFSTLAAVLPSPLKKPSLEDKEAKTGPRRTIILRPTPPPFSIAPPPPLSLLHTAAPLKEYYQQTILLSLDNQAHPRQGHLLAGSVTAERLDEIRKAMQQFPAEAEMATSPLKEASDKLTFVCMVSDPEGNTPYNELDKQMKGIALFYNYCEADGEKNSPLCISGTIDLVTLQQIIDCCLATNRPFQLGAANTDLKITWGEGHEPLVIPKNNKAVPDVPPQLQALQNEHNPCTPQLNRLQTQIQDQQKAADPTIVEAYKGRVGSNILNLQQEEPYKTNIQKFCSVNPADPNHKNLSALTQFIEEVSEKKYHAESLHPGIR